MSDKVYLVTGAAGFIGSHIVEEVIQEAAPGTKILSIDNLSTGSSSTLTLLQKLAEEKGIHFLSFKEDIRNKAVIDEIFSSHKPSYVAHQAAVASVQQSIDQPSYTASVNLLGTLNVLEAAATWGAKHFTFASSAAVYGNPKSIPCDELSPTSPISPYGCEKLMGEQYMHLFAAKHREMTIDIFRYFNVYGPRQDPSSEYSGVISIFNDAFSKGLKAPTIFGDGKQFRDFIYVKDIARANLKALKRSNPGSHLFCLGTGRPTNLLDLFQSFEFLYQKGWAPQHKEARYGDVKESLSTPEKVLHALSLESFQPLQKGIEQLVLSQGSLPLVQK